ncbi:thioredoxin-like protein [Aspergillus karnatakaensis]|uniref:phosducin family protein n=1 Tax=Aspergillus karnatakaensis TaxID=1810916 RepID=UPI003CCCDB30
MSSAQDEFNQLFSNRERSSAHPEDRNNSSDRDSSPDPEDLDPAQHSDAEDMPAMASRTATYTIPSTRFDANTGPKGVIADAQAFERARKSTFRKSFVSGTSAADRSHISSKSVTDAATLLHNSPPPDGSLSDLDEGDEDKFMRQWRQSRMQQLQSQKGRRPSPWRKYYGSVDTVDAVGYLDAIEKVPSDQIVVVCLYDPESNTSTLVEDCLNTIAARNTSVHFIKLHHEIAEMDHIHPPAILAYRDADVFATIVDIPRQIPKGRSCSADSLEDVLKLNRVL